MFGPTRPMKPDAVPLQDVPLTNQLYLQTTPRGSDPSIVWGTSVDMTGITEFLAERNRTSQAILTPAPILYRAVGLALRKFPDFNRRLFGKRAYEFDEINILTPVRLPNREMAVVLVRDVDQQSYEELALNMWRTQQSLRKQASQPEGTEGLFRRLPAFVSHAIMRSMIWMSNNFLLPMNTYNANLRGAPVLVNYLGFSHAAPLTSFKPSRFGSTCSMLNVTLGPTNESAVVVDGQVAVRPIANLFVRGDHRLVDAHQIGRFAQELRIILGDPVSYERSLPPTATTPARVLAAQLEKCPV